MVARTTLGATAAALFAVLLAAGCGGSEPPSRSAHPATLHVRQQWVSGGLYEIEAAAGGRVDATVRLTPGKGCTIDANG